MDKTGKQEPDDTIARQRALDKAFFCFYKRRAVFRTRSRMVLEMREGVTCCCPLHLVRFEFTSN